MGLFNIKFIDTKRLSEIDWVYGKQCIIIDIADNVIIPGSSGEFWSQKTGEIITYCTYTYTYISGLSEDTQNWNIGRFYIPPSIINYVFVQEV